MRSVLTALCLFTTSAHAVPAQFTHQGRLLDAEGAPLEDEATITFRVTDSETGGTALWEEDITVLLTNGFYSAILGASEDNPLDTDVLSQAPVWLEIQLDGETAMFPRSAINAVPYATMATVAEELSGGPVDASQIAVDGTPVVNELGEWVGPAPTVNWSDIEGMPEDFADGIDDDTDTDTDSFAALGTSCLDGDIPVWDSTSSTWICDMDQDTLAAISCMEGQLIAWSDESTGFVCAEDMDTVLTDEDVEAIVADNGYAMASEIFSGSFLDLDDVPDGLADGDDNTQLTADEVDAIVADNGYAMSSDVFSGNFNDLADIPDGLDDGDDNTQLTPDEVDAIVADRGYAMTSEIFSGSFDDLTDRPTMFSGSFSGLTDIPPGLADGDDDTQLTEYQVDTMVANNGFAFATDIFSGEFSDLSGVPSSFADGDTTLSEDEVDAMVSDNGYAMSSELEAMSAEIASLRTAIEALEAAAEEASITVPSYCSAGTTSEGTRFMYCDDYRTFVESQSACTDAGWDGLAEIFTSDEHGFVMDLLGGTSAQVFVGFSSAPPTWASGVPLTAGYYVPHSPGLTTRDGCGVIVGHSSTYWTAGCTEDHPYVCQIR